MNLRGVGIGVRSYKGTAEEEGCTFKGEMGFRPNTSTGGTDFEREPQSQALRSPCVYTHLIITQSCNLW